MDLIQKELWTKSKLSLSVFQSRREFKYLPFNSFVVIQILRNNCERRRIYIIYKISLAPDSILILWNLFDSCLNITNDSKCDC